MNRLHLTLSLGVLLLCGRSAFAQGYPMRMHMVEVIYSINFDDNVDVRTLMPPPSAIRDGLTRKELQALRDRGLPGYRAKLSDLGGAWYVTIYLERLVPGRDGKVRHIPLPPAFCQVHHNHWNRKNLCLIQQQLSLGNPPPPLLIGNPGGGGLPLPDVRLKRIVVDSYIRLPGAGGGLIR